MVWRTPVLPARRALERRWLIAASAAALCGLVFALRQDIFALQAALAVQNRRLLERERDRILILAELRDAQERLIERGAQMQALVSRQEAERGEVARELHDDAAQVLAAVLLDLKGLERQVGQERGAERWQALRANVDATLQSLRSLAVRLRPAILRLGLQTALEDLADAAREQGFQRFQLDLDAATEITPELETVVYRIVEEVLAAVGPAHEVVVSTNPVPAVIVAVHGPAHAINEDRLTVLKARLDIAGGTLSTDADALVASVPIAVPSETQPPLPAAGGF